MGRADDIACLLTQPGNVVMGQAADRQGAPDNDTYLAAVDRGPDRFPPRWPDPASALDGNRHDRHLVGDRDDEGAVFELTDRAVR